MNLIVLNLLSFRIYFSCLLKFIPKYFYGALRNQIAKSLNRCSLAHCIYILTTHTITIFTQTQFIKKKCNINDNLYVVCFHTGHTLSTICRQYPEIGNKQIGEMLLTGDLWITAISLLGRNCHWSISI